MDDIRNIEKIEMDFKKVLEAKSFLEIVDNNVETAFALGFLREDLQEPLSLVIQLRGEEGIRLVKSFDVAMQAARPYVTQASDLADSKIESGEDCTLVDVVNYVLNNLEYKEENDKLYVAFILGMWALNMAKEDENFEDDDDDFVENPSADA